MSASFLAAAGRMNTLGTKRVSCIQEYLEDSPESIAVRLSISLLQPNSGLTMSILAIYDTSPKY